MTQPQRPVDASMNLLKVLVDTALEPSYRTAKAGRSPRSRVFAVVAFVVAGLMFGAAAVDTVRSEPEAVKERQSLVAQVKQATRTDDDLRARLAALQQQERDLSAPGAAGSSQSQLNDLGAVSGAVPVEGPGVVVVADDAESLSGASGQQQVTDTDLRQLVNALWQSGAEAVAVNGHRISSRTAIRSAGSAITVDYVSLVRPYRVEAIGDPKALPATLNQTAGGRWWSGLRQNYGIRYDVSTSDRLDLPADPGLGLTHARPPG